METNLTSQVQTLSASDMIKQILLAAVNRNVSDIHFEPYEHKYRVRYRQDGLLAEMASLPLHINSPLTSCIKIMANLDISERRLPQDGHFNLQLNDKHVDCRVSTCPTLFGEKVVIRILEQTITQLGLDALGLNAVQRQLFLNAMSKSQGMILVTGPTGSGKTVSLYSALALLNSEEKNISTIEDPVEIKLPGINQVNINTKAGLNFATALRAFLRQDPDVIMLGEIRDSETAEIAIKAAQTGHLVLSTLHTNSAAETLNRLMNMGISPFNLANTVHLVIAQRLARRLCTYCKKPRQDLSAQQLITLGFTAIQSAHCNLYQACGCEYCSHGYDGQIGLFELLPLSKTIAELIMRDANSFDIQQQANQEGMTTIYQSGLEKAQQGLISLEEMQRVTN